jgi:hypothetical protein
MKTMNSYTHVYLYAKNHYKITNVIEDLKILIFQRNNTLVEHITTKDILRSLLPLAFEAIQESDNPSYSFEEFVITLIPSESWKINAQNDNLETRIIKNCLSVIRHTTVERLNLGEPDFSILPKRS